MTGTPVSESVEHQSVDPGTLLPGEVRSIEAGVKALWESVRKAAETVSRLRDRNRELQGVVERLEKELHAARSEATAAKRQTAEPGPAAGASIGGAERDVLAAKVKDLIARLDAYL
jgi:predicted RNase H-like nuclease (RuvC/YqgF family)